MARPTDERLAEIAGGLKVAATWVDGPRKVKLIGYAEELLGEEAVGAPDETSQDELPLTEKVEEPAQPRRSRREMPTE